MTNSGQLRDLTALFLVYSPYLDILMLLVCSNLVNVHLRTIS